MRRPRLYLTIQLCGVTAKARSSGALNKYERCFEELGFLPRLIGIAHGTAHVIADMHVGEGFSSAQPVRN